MTEFGGPEVLSSSSCPSPEPGPGRGADQRHPGGRELRRHAHPHQLLCAQGDVAAGARRRGCGRRRRARRQRLSEGQRVIALTGAAAMRSTRVAPRELTLPDARRASTTLHGARVLIQGTTAWHLYRTAARVARGRERGRALRGRRRRLAGGAARHAARRRARDRGGLERARSARLRSSSAPTSRSTPTPRD